jgi:multidrug resistance efflux pump
MMTRSKHIRAVLVLCAAVAASSKAMADDKDTVKVTPQVSGVIVTLGSEGKPLAVGDRVVKDQIIGVLDDRLARLDLQMKEAILGAAKVDRDAAQLLHEEAKATIMAFERWVQQGAAAATELRREKALEKKLAQEVVVKETRIHLAKLEVDRAKLLVEMHVLRSPVAGEVRAVYKTRGEGVKALESVVQIKEGK